MSLCCIKMNVFIYKTGTRKQTPHNSSSMEFALSSNLSNLSYKQNTRSQMEVCAALLGYLV